jgi:RES domain-containing protein
MRVWRVTRKAHTERPLSGEGAQRYGGRWNHIGVAVVYTSQSLSLALLEYLVNLPMTDLPSDLFSLEIEILDDFPRTEISRESLPATWRNFPGIEALKDIGTSWARDATTPILVVPSVVIPGELNFLINPMHPLSRRINIVSVEPFVLDTRLYTSRKPVRKARRKITR